MGEPLNVDLMVQNRIARTWWVGEGYLFILALAYLALSAHTLGLQLHAERVDAHWLSKLGQDAPSRYPAVADKNFNIMYLFMNIKIMFSYV